MANPAKINYALAIDSAVVYVALALDKAGNSALSVEELARDYKHPVPSDYARIKLHEVIEDDQEAREWLIRRALSYLGDEIEVVDDLVIIRNGFRFEDLKLHGKKLSRPGPDIHEKLHDPFNPFSGRFADNIRTELKDSKDPAWDELVESMKHHGWLPEFPALVDERGVVLVGHRRMGIAKLLNIEPVRQTIHIGIGDAADARRLKIAIGSNVGQKKLSPNDRKRIAEYLYQAQEWSQQRIAEALNVHQTTIGEDLRELRTSLISEKKKRGRPPGSKSIALAEKRADLDEKVFPLAEQGMSRDQIVQEIGSTERNVRDALQRHAGYVKAKEEMQAVEMQVTFDHECTCPTCGNKHTKPV